MIKRTLNNRPPLGGRSNLITCIGLALSLTIIYSQLVDNVVANVAMQASMQTVQIPTFSPSFNRATNKNPSRVSLSSTNDVNLTGPLKAKIPPSLQSSGSSSRLANHSQSQPNNPIDFAFSLFKAHETNLKNFMDNGKKMIATVTNPEELKNAPDKLIDAITNNIENTIVSKCSYVELLMRFSTWRYEYLKAYEQNPNALGVKTRLLEEYTRVDNEMIKEMKSQEETRAGEQNQQSGDSTSSSLPQGDATTLIPPADSMDYIYEVLTRTIIRLEKEMDIKIKPAPEEPSSFDKICNIFKGNQKEAIEQGEDARPVSKQEIQDTLSRLKMATITTARVLLINELKIIGRIGLSVVAMNGLFNNPGLAMADPLGLIVKILSYTTFAGAPMIARYLADVQLRAGMKIINMVLTLNPTWRCSLLDKVKQTCDQVKLGVKKVFSDIMEKLGEKKTDSETSFSLKNFDGDDVFPQYNHSDQDGLFEDRVNSNFEFNGIMA